MLTLLTVLQFSFIVAVVVFLAINAHFLVKAEPVTGSLPESPFVSICVPARNEERDLEACLASLLEQGYPHFEVIVVDDNSTDRTPVIIDSLKERYSHLIAIRGAPLPPDWYGKPFALHQAVQKSRGEILLFTDADPIFRPHAITSAVYLMQERRMDLLTLLPKAEFGSFWERAVQPLIFAFIAAFTRFGKVNDPNSPAAMGIGSFLMMRRQVYDRVGGHEALKQTILEDIGMGRLVKQSGARIMIADGRKIYSIRMYHSLEEIWVGWRKNIFLAMNKSVLKTVYYILCVWGFVITPWLVAGYHVGMQTSLWGQVPALAGLALVLISKATLCHELHLPKRNLLLFPLGALVMAAIMINSMVHVLFRGHSEWRGRTYSQPVR